MLEQKIADYFISLPKKKKDSTIYVLNSGSKISIPLLSVTNSPEEFLLDIHKHQINLYKYTFHFQNRVRKSIGLIRIDFEGPPHKNPDGVILKSPHVHIYKEGYDLKWAYPLPFTQFGKSYTLSNDFGKNLDNFLHLCNVTDAPSVQMSLL